MKRAAIITGATRGIGRGLFKRLAENEVSIATIYHSDETSAERLVNDAESFGIDFFIVKQDIRELDKIPFFIETVYHKFGRIDYLVNNIGCDVFKCIADIELEEWLDSQNVILNAPFLFCKNTIPIMRKQNFGRIVNIGASSKDYMKGAIGMSPFGIYKAALTVFTKCLALEEIENGITVNMVAPGSTKDAGVNPEEKRIPLSQIPIGRRVEINEVVDAIMYFLADNSNAVTGQFIGVNGGLST